MFQLVINFLLLLFLISCSNIGLSHYRGILPSEKEGIFQKIQNCSRDEVEKILGKPISFSEGRETYWLYYLKGASLSVKEVESAKNDCIAIPFHKLNASVFRGYYWEEVPCPPTPSKN